MSSFLAKGLPDTFQSEVDILYHVSLFSTLFCKILTLSATIFQELNFTFLSFQWFVFGFKENYYATRATKLHFLQTVFYPFHPLRQFLCCNFHLALSPPLLRVARIRQLFCSQQLVFCCIMHV